MIEMESAPVLPAASLAVTVIRFKPSFRVIELTLQFESPTAVPFPPVLLVQLTEVTPTLSEAVPPTEIVAAALV